MIRVHNEASADLRAITATVPADGAHLVALIQQLRASPELRARLLDRDFGNDGLGPIGVKLWRTMHNQTGHKPVYRLRAWELEHQGLHYRLLYLYNWPDQSFNILAVVARQGFDYDDPNHPIRQRIRACIRRDFTNA